MSLKIVNVKFHFKIDRLNKIKKTGAPFYALPNAYVKKYHNYCVYKSKYTYIVFHEVNYINVTGVPNITEIREAIRHFCYLFKINSCRLIKNSTQVDNLTVCGRFEKEFDLNLVKQQLLKLRPKIIRVLFNQSKFPGMSISLTAPAKKHIRKSPTLILFSNGKFTIVGGKCLVEAQKIYAFIEKLLVKT